MIICVYIDHCLKKFKSHPLLQSHSTAISKMESPSPFYGDSSLGDVQHRLKMDDPYVSQISRFCSMHKQSSGHEPVGNIHTFGFVHNFSQINFSFIFNIVTLHCLHLVKKVVDYMSGFLMLQMIHLLRNKKLPNISLMMRWG